MSLPYVRTCAEYATNAIMNSAIRIPGTKPAAKSRPIETFACTP